MLSRIRSAYTKSILLHWILSGYCEDKIIERTGKWDSTFLRTYPNSLLIIQVLYLRVRKLCTHIEGSSIESLMNYQENSNERDDLLKPNILESISMLSPKYDVVSRIR